MKLKPAMRKTLEFLTEPHTIDEICIHTGEAYETVKARCKELYYDGVVDKLDIPGAKKNRGPRIRFVIAPGVWIPRERTPQEHAKIEARRVEKEEPKKKPQHGGRIIELTDKAKWAWGGQLDSGYGPRFKAAILGE